MKPFALTPKLAAHLVRLAIISGVSVYGFYFGWSSVAHFHPAANACVNNLRQIDAAKQQWALENNKTHDAMPTWDDIRPYVGRGPSGALPYCPLGGVYTIGRLDENPTCSWRRGVPDIDDVRPDHSLIDR